MGKPLRIALVVLGLALATNGVASLTGGWLGKPPWWEQRETGYVLIDNSQLIDSPEGVTIEVAGDTTLPKVIGPSEDGKGILASVDLIELREGRGWISGGVLAAGLALATFAAWPRRAKAASSSASVATPKRVASCPVRSSRRPTVHVSRNRVAPRTRRRFKA